MITQDIYLYGKLEKISPEFHQILLLNKSFD